MLKIKNIAKSFGGQRVLTNINLSVKAGDRIGIVGGNASGKSTLINISTGFYAPDYGEIFLENKPITNITNWKFSTLGLIRTFQSSRFQSEVILANQLTLSSSISSHALELCKIAGLKNYIYNFPDEIPMPALRKAEVIRSMLLNPKVLFLDEPSAGLTREEIQQFAFFMQQKLSDNVALVLVEHRDEMMRILVRDRYYLKNGILKKEEKHLA